MESRRFILVFICLFLILSFRIPYGFAIGNSVKETTLKGNWEKVFNLLKRDNKEAEDPVAKFIMGHACLATNRNNASLLLFLSAKKEDIKLWSEWTNALLKKNSRNPIALYLSADAKARTGKLEEAKEGFKRALQIKEDFALAYNARGVVRVLTNDWNNALMDFIVSTNLAPNLADAHANLGTYWILKEAAEGALEKFNQAININSEFALAYNGIGCAYFGRGKYGYEDAIDNMEKAFDLCPVMIPALSNQGIVLAAITSQTTHGKTDKKPGTTFVARSNLERMDYSSFTTAGQKIKYHQSVEKLAETNSALGVRAYSAQISKIRNRINDLSNKLEQRRSAFQEINRGERILHQIDQTLGLMDFGMETIKPFSQPEGWKRFTDFSRKTLETTANMFPKDTMGEYYSGLASRALSKNPFGIVRCEIYLMEKLAHTYGDIAEAGISIYSGELTRRTRQLYDLEQRQGRFLAQAINQGVDFSKTDMFGTSSMHILNKTRNYIPEHSIPYRSPLTQFNMLPGAIGKDITSIGKTPLVVIEGNTDPYRLGTMARGFERQGIQTLSVPSTIDSQHFARSIGADRVIKITPEPGSAAWLPKIPVPNPEVSGVTQDMSDAPVDLGNWPVATIFGLLYKTE
jgi:tetratricopeptide (TPR) repeat protein